MKLGRFDQTNDPRETHRWEFHAGAIARSKDLSSDEYASGTLSAWLSAAIQGRAKVACFCTDTAPLTGDHYADVYKRGFSRPRMWAQYGDKHRGVCLIFDKARFIQALRTAFEGEGSLLICQPVEYRNHPGVPSLREHEFSVTAEDLEQLGRAQYPRHHVGRYWRRLFFEKALDWRDEVEWRALLMTDTEDPTFVETSAALVGVVHGAEIVPQVSDKLIETCDKPEVGHLGLLWKNGFPWYDIGGVRWSYANRRLLEKNGDDWRAASSQ